MTEEQRTEVRSQKTEDRKQKSEYRTLDKEQTDFPQQNEDVETTVETVVEAVLFASDEPLSEARLAKIVETTVKQARQCIKDLNDKYQANNNAFRIEQIAGGYQMLTLSPYNYWLKKLLRARSDS